MKEAANANASVDILVAVGSTEYECPRPIVIRRRDTPKVNDEAACE